MKPVTAEGGSDTYVRKACNCAKVGKSAAAMANLLRYGKGDGGIGIEGIRN